MLKLGMVASAAAALLLCTAAVPDQANAAGAKAPRAAACMPKKHRWGDRDWEIIRWSYGDCKIWRDDAGPPTGTCGDRKSTRLNSSHLGISYAVFCLKKTINY